MYKLSICVRTAVDSLGVYLLMGGDCGPSLVFGLADLDQMDEK
jgi:hypothetical protein